MVPRAEVAASEAVETVPLKTIQALMDLLIPVAVAAQVAAAVPETEREEPVVAVSLSFAIQIPTRKLQQQGHLQLQLREDT